MQSFKQNIFVIGGRIRIEPSKNSLNLEYYQTDVQT